MANKVKKTEHSGSKKGRGAYCGPRKDARTESNKTRRRIDRSESESLRTNPTNRTK